MKTQKTGIRKTQAHVPPASVEDGSDWGLEDGDVLGSGEEVEEKVVSLRLDDVPGSEEELGGVEVVLLLVLVEVGGTLVVLDGGVTLLVELLAVGPPVVDDEVVEESEVVVVSVDVGVWVTVTVVESVVELVVSRLATCKMEAARASSAWLPTSVA